MWWLRPFYAINTLSYDFCNRKRFSLHYIKYRCQQNWTKNWIENLLKWSYLKSKSLTFRYLDALLRAFSQYCEIWLTPLVSLLTCDDVHHDGVRDAGGGAAGVLPAVLQPHPRDPEHQHVVRLWLIPTERPRLHYNLELKSWEHHFYPNILHTFGENYIIPSPDQIVFWLKQRTESGTQKQVTSLAYLRFGNT